MERITIRLPRKLREELMAAAAFTGLSENEVCRVAFKGFLEAVKKRRL